MNLLDFVFPKRCLGCGSIGKCFCNRCVRTVRVTSEREMICPMCEKLAIDGATHPRCRTRYSIDGLTSFFRYDGVVRKAIKAIKYRFVSDLAQEFVDLIPFLINNLTIQQYNPEERLPRSVPLSGSTPEERVYGAGNSTMLLPIPLHQSRYRERGFNQAEVLGKMLAHRLHVPIRGDILKRVKKTTPQVEMKNRDDRLKNMDKVFSVGKVGQWSPEERLPRSVPLRGSTTGERVYGAGNTAIILFDDVFTTGATLRSAANVLKRAGAPFVWGITMAR